MKYTILDVTEPVSGRVVYKDRWWACIDGDKTKALFWRTSPQCNKNKQIIQWGIDKDQFDKHNVIPTFIETAFVPLNN